MNHKESKTIDMTTGPILKLVVLFAIPICAGNILQQLYSTVDTLIIGNFCGSLSLAAVGTSAQPVEFLLCIFLGLGTGVSILVSQHKGRGDPDGLREVVSTATTFLYICAVPLSILGILIGPLFLTVMQVPADVFPYAASYLRIVFLGSLGNMGYNMNAGILRGIGNSRASLLFLLISCLVNIFLDLVFVAGFGMDVAGAALATSIAMFASWFFSIAYIRTRHPELELTLLPRRLNRAVLKEIITVGLPLGLNNSIYSVGHILLQSLTNAQGSLFMAACSVATKLTGLANVAISSFASAATTFAGQNLGAGNAGRIKKGAWQIPLASALVSGACGAVGTLFAAFILRLFTRDPAVLELAILYVRVVLPFFWMFAVMNAIVFFLNGVSEIRYPTIVNILMLWAVRIPSAYLIARYINGYYLMASVPISYGFAMIAMVAYFFTKRWKRILGSMERAGAKA